MRVVNARWVGQSMLSVSPLKDPLYTMPCPTAFETTAAASLGNESLKFDAFANDPVS